MDFIHEVTRTRLLALDGSSLARPFGDKYENYGLYPIQFLRRGIVGKGQFHMDYDYPRAYAAYPRMGGVPTRSEVDTIAPRPGEVLQVMSVAYATSEYQTVEVMWGPMVRGTVTCDTVVDGADTLEVLVLDRLEGAYVRRWGTHRLQAIAIWRSVTHGDWDPPQPRFGARAYFPSLSLRLPLFLPDLGLEDLRKFDYPVPIMTVDWFGRSAEHSPDWIHASADGFLHPWAEAGRCPAVLRSRFPDL